MRASVFLKSAGLSALLLASACSPRVIALKVGSGFLERGMPAMREEPDPEFARDALPGQLKLVESLLRSDPDDPALLGALAEGFVGYAFLFVEDEAPERARDLYRRGAEAGLKLAARNPKLRGLGEMSPEEMESALAAAGAGDVPALYWTALAWAGRANLGSSDPAALAAMPKAERFMSRVLALAPGFQFGGADQFFGVYYCARPRIAGGDPARGRKHFEAAAARADGAFLMSKFLNAKHCATAELDEESFRRLLAEIAEADPAALPEARLANEVAQRKSLKLMERIDDLF